MPPREPVADPERSHGTMVLHLSLEEILSAPEETLRVPKGSFGFLWEQKGPLRGSRVRPWPHDSPLDPPLT